jgi:hypothetical protein
MGLSAIDGELKCTFIMVPITSIIGDFLNLPRCCNNLLTSLYAVDGGGVSNHFFASYWIEHALFICTVRNTRTDPVCLHSPNRELC